MGVLYEWSLLDQVGRLLSHFGTIYWNTFFSFNPTLSVPSLLSALLVAYVCVSFNRWRRRRGIKLKVLVRAFFPRRLFTSASPRTDVGFFILNTSIITALIGWAILSGHLVASVVNAQLVAVLGAMPPSSLTALQMSLIMTVVMFLAYELSYYTDHYLSHTVPFLWEFHKVHHTAEVLTPLTNLRIHPVDSIVFYNIMALVMGSATGILTYLFGTSASPFTLDSTNVILLAFIYVIGHLQHSHFWIAFTGTWGRLLLSPAHHQIHHSTNPVHFNRNLGSFLAVFDWMFGTLHVPAAKRERLSFGVVEPEVADQNTISETLIQPFGNALGHFVPQARDDAGGSPQGDVATR